MPSYHLHTSDDAEEINTEKHVELIVAKEASTGTARFITGKLPLFELPFTGNLTAHCTTRLTINTTWQTDTLTLTHKHTVPTGRLQH
jgi:hypothetical protein